MRLKTGCFCLLNQIQSILKIVQLEKSIVIEIYDHYLKKLNLEEIDNSEYNIIQSIKRWSK